MPAPSCSSWPKSARLTDNAKPAFDQVRPHNPLSATARTDTAGLLQGYSRSSVGVIKTGGFILIFFLNEGDEIVRAEARNY